ncbi:helix-turn-helix domain-containing protein [Actinospica acidithermotolerans]
MTTDIPEAAPVWETGIELPGIVPLLAPARRTLAVLAALQAPAPVPEIAAHADLPSAVTLRHLQHLARLGLAAPDKADSTRYQAGPGRCPVRPALLSARGRTAVLAWRLESAGQAARLLGAEVLPNGEQIPPDPDRPPHLPAGRTEALAWFTGEREALASDVESAYELGEDHLAWRLALLVLGLTCFTGPWHGWRGIHQCGLAAARRGQHRPAQAMLEELAGKLELTSGNRAAALEHQQRALTIRATGGDVLGVLRSLNAIGLIFLRERAWREAAEVFDWALEMAGNLGDEQFETFALLNLGAVHAAEGEHARAAAELESAIARLRAAGRDPYIANALQDLALAWYGAGDLERAAHCAEQGVEAAVSAGIPMFLPGPLIESARIQARRGHLRVALALLYEAHGIYAEIGDEARTARTLAEIEATARTAASSDLSESADPAAAQASE